MKVRWQETATHHIAVIRPDELFDLSTAQWPDPDDREVPVRARNVVSGEMDIWAMAYNKKGWPLHVWQRIWERKPEWVPEYNAEQLEKLEQRRTA